MQNILAKTENFSSQPGGILIITINRPDKLNALNKTTLNEIKEAMKAAYDDASIAGVVITGSGNKAFVAGADISEFLSYSQQQGKELSAHGHDVFNYIENCPKPVIAAVNGFALGGGCELAMACHLRVAADNAKFGQPEVNLGLIPGYGGTQRLIRYLGKTKALELLMTSDMIGAEDALRLGLVNDVVTQDALIPKCMEILEKIKTKSPQAIAEIIRCANAYFEEGTNGMQTEIDRFSACFGTDDFKEGVTAFLEKRKPSFTRK